MPDLLGGPENRPSFIFKVARSDLEERVQEIFVYACNSIWSPNVTDTNALMYSVAEDFILKGADKASVMTFFTEVEDKFEVKAVKFFKMYKDDFQELLVKMGWYTVTGSSRWDAGDPLALGSNRAVVTWRAIEFTLATLWNRYAGYNEYAEGNAGAEPKLPGFDFDPDLHPETSINSKGDYLAGDIYTPVSTKPKPPDPLPQGIWSEGHVESILKSNFMLWLKGDGDALLRLLVNKEDIPANKPGWEGAYVYTTEVNNEGGQFRLLIRWREEGRLSNKYVAIESEFLDDKRLRIFMVDETGMEVYSRDWEVFPPITEEDNEDGI